MEVIFLFVLMTKAHVEGVMSFNTLTQSVNAMQNEIYCELIKISNVNSFSNAVASLNFQFVHAKKIESIRFPH